MLKLCNEQHITGFVAQYELEIKGIYVYSQGII